jgi:Ca-activated chloride channel family protein
VAIDSQVRLVDGQAVTVKQPLPLPQGVSNYAVGEAANLAAPSSASFGFVQAHRQYSKNAADKQEAAVEERDQKTLRLTKIEVNGDLTETSVRSTVMKELEAINRCVKKSGIEKSSLKGEGVFALLVGPDGGVKEVRVEKGSAVPEDLSRCIQEILRTMKFQADPGRRDIPLKLTLSFD